MKRLLGLTVLFVVLYVCVPSYGTPGNYFLIYNVSASVKGANNDLAASISLKGYLVADINDDDGSIVDANLIMYGKDSLDNNRNTYVQLNYQGGNSDQNIRTRIHYNGDFAGFDVWNYYYAPFYFEVFVIGKMTPKNIGLSSAKYVASSLKGPVSVWGGMLLDADDDILGTGNVSASLDLKTTKLVNQNNWTQDEIINGTNGLIQKLKGYSLATLP